jgi:hypothetical protein
MSVQYANSGITQDGLALYYDTKFLKSFRGESTVNLFSEVDFNNWSAYNQKNVTPFVEAPDYNFAYKIEDNRTNSFDGVQLQSISVTDGLVYTLSTWFIVDTNATARSHFRMRVTVGGVAGFLSLRLYNDTGNVDLVRNDLNGGSPATVSSFGVSETIKYNKYIWKRAYVTFTMPSGITSDVRCEFIVAHDNLSNTASANNIGSSIAWAPQLEQKSYPTPFVNGTRTNLVNGGGGFLDLSKSSRVDSNTDNIEYDNTGPYVSSLNKYVWFGGTNSVLQTLTNDGNSHTFECWWMPLGTPPGANDGYFCGRRGNHSGHRQLKANGLQHGCIIWFSDNTNSAVGSNYTYPSYNVWGHLCYVVDELNNLARFYVNGSQSGNALSITKNLRSYGTVDYHLFSGSGTNWSGNGRLGAVRFYSKALSASEVLQNYNAQKHLYI